MMHMDMGWIVGSNWICLYITTQNDPTNNVEKVDQLLHFIE